ncbi:phosphoglucosamine mutase [Kiloniella antarctica]|uniref:Phosphoglucosamine mutase n=1 Tax=Kiloniella antarctica TaxID=1550907 RepID=A0ABW5BG02_9PROT
MSRKYFGTDGIRGKANEAPVTAEIALAVAKAAGAHFLRGSHRHTVVIGKDTRLSGYLLEPALTAGFVSVGMDVVILGPMPTPAVGMLTRSMRADMGVMISASHNPYEDNGIKLFGPDGFKLSDAVEMKIERRLQDIDSIPVATSAKLGRARRLDDALGRYIEFVKNTFPKDLRLDGLKVVIDCANGAAYKVAPTVLYELGANVIPVAVTPDGFNINKDCGATSTALMQEAVVAHGADIGIALDGDADRLILADEHGQIVDGDQVMALIAKTLQSADLLKGGGVVATVMSNMGLENYLKDLGLDLIRTPVGDRYVVQAMREQGYNLGGEQSGHMVMSDHTTTGDGLIAALQVLAALIRADRPASEVVRGFIPLPQLLENIRITSGVPLDDVLGLSVVKEAILAGEAQLNGSGRVLIRKSGTEPLIRVMAEGEDSDLVRTVVSEISATITSAS